MVLYRSLALVLLIWPIAAISQNLTTYGNCAPILTQNTGNIDISCVIEAQDETKTFKYYTLGLLASLGDPVAPYLCGQLVRSPRHINISDFARGFSSARYPEIFSSTWKTWYRPHFDRLASELRKHKSLIAVPVFSEVANSNDLSGSRTSFFSPLFTTTENQRYHRALELGINLGLAADAYGKLAQINAVITQHGRVVPDGSVRSGLPRFDSNDGTIWQSDFDYLTDLSSCLNNAYTARLRHLEQSLARNGLQHITAALPRVVDDISYKPETHRAWDFVTLQEIVSPLVEGAWR